MCTIHIIQEQLAVGEGKKMKCEMFLLLSLLNLSGQPCLINDGSSRSWEFSWSSVDGGYFTQVSSKVTIFYD